MKVHSYQVSVTNGIALVRLDIVAPSAIHAQQLALQEAERRGERGGFARGSSLWIDSCQRG